MPKQRLSGFQRLAIFMQKRRMGVPERVPRNPRLPDPIARRSKLPVVQVFVAERSALCGLKDQILGIRRIRARRASSTRQSAELMAITRRLLFVFSDPNSPEE